MDIQVTEFELKFSAAVANLTAMIMNYSDSVNAEVKEKNKIINTLQIEVKRLVDLYEPKKETSKPKTEVIEVKPKKRPE